MSKSPAKVTPSAPNTTAQIQNELGVLAQMRASGRTHDRKQDLIRWIQTEGTVTYRQVQDRFKVSPITARRDIEELATLGIVTKVLRGAIYAPSQDSLSESPLVARQNENLAAKRIIAAAAMKFVKPGKTLFIDASTTCIEFARLLAQSNLPVTVVTNSILVSACFTEHPAVTLIQLGGVVNLLNSCTVGSAVERAARSYFFDFGFFSTLGYVRDVGTFESSLDISGVKLAYVAQCKEVILLVDHSKFGRRALNQVFADQQINKIITDQRINGLSDPRMILANSELAGR